MAVPVTLALVPLALGAALASASAAQVALAPDHVELVNGTKLTGRVVFEDHEVVLLRADGRTRELRKEQVVSIASRERRVGEILDRLATLRPDEIDQRVAVAARARAIGLEGEAEALYLSVLLADPGREDARRALGHQKVGSAWRAPWKGEWLPLTGVARQRLHWDDAWVFETAHFRLRANVDLPAAIEAAIDVEVAYRAFREVLGQPLGLHEVDALLDVHVHGDPNSLPLLDSRSGGLFDPELNVLVVDATRSLDRGLLFHEVTHQLLHNTLASAAGKEVNALPRWVDEGLAEFMSVGLDTREKELVFDWCEFSLEHVREHLTAREPVEVGRVLALGPDDFVNEDRGAASYALAYTLVDFCMQADSGRLQDEFLRFLAVGRERAWLPGDFVELVVGDDPRRFAAEWQAYVAEYADDPLRARLRRHPPR